MAASIQRIATFPSVELPAAEGPPVEVALIAQLGIGAGDALFADMRPRQAAHPAFVDALDEPSARIGAMHLAKGDRSSLYSFAVGESGHPFHRHAGHRVFTAISGSSGARLRFSTATQADVDADPEAFIRALRQVDIPADCLFTVRFGGGTWHQFVPRRGDRGHPALVALSCHTDELGGALPDALRARVAANDADIPSLTDVLPAPLARRVATLDATAVPTIALALHAAPGSVAGSLCATVRRVAGRIRRVLVTWRAGTGFLRRAAPRHGVRQAPLPQDALLTRHLQDAGVHEDCVELRLGRDEVAGRSAEHLLGDVLEGFLENRPKGVARLMALRNVLVAPLRLRTSPLGCPVSSLLAPDPARRFMERFPVIDAAIEAPSRAEVVLGADDRHLRFRSGVAVQIEADGGARLRLATRVLTRNAFGALYMRLIDRVHRHYIAPALLRAAAGHATGDA